MRCSKSSTKKEVINFYIKKEERSQINKLTLHFQILEKGEQIKSKFRTKKINTNQSRKKIQTAKQQKKFIKLRVFQIGKQNRQTLSLNKNKKNHE